jgi:hypothetical protein
MLYRNIASASSTPGSENVFQKVLAILKADAFMKELFKELTAKTSPGNINRNFATLIKRFTVELKNDATCWNEQRIAKFTRSRAKNIPQKITDATFPSKTENSTAQTALVKNDEAESSESSNQRLRWWAWISLWTHQIRQM